MINVQADFRTRAEEVERYFRFLRAFDEKHVFTAPVGVSSPFTLTEQSALFKTLKANGFLLLYNLIESTCSNAIEAIFEKFRAERVSFDDCRAEVKKIILENLKKHNVDKILPSLSELSVDVVVSTFRKNELFGGNVDGQRLREVAKSYGFKHPTKKSNELLTVKSYRNDLAHGTKSFADVGRDFDLKRLGEIMEEVINYLEEFLKNIASYLSAKHYRKTKEESSLESDALWVI